MKCRRKLLDKNVRILFRLPFTVYFLGWQRDVRLFLLMTKEWDENGYYWQGI